MVLVTVAKEDKTVVNNAEVKLNGVVIGKTDAGGKLITKPLLVCNLYEFEAKNGTMTGMESKGPLPMIVTVAITIK